MYTELYLLSPARSGSGLTEKHKASCAEEFVFVDLSRPTRKEKDVSFLICTQRDICRRVYTNYFH